jgi:lipid-binding SYLF domain-containing protein
VHDVRPPSGIGTVMPRKTLLRCAAAAVVAFFASGCEREPSSPAERRIADRDRAAERLDESTRVVQAMLENDQIPRERRERARCVVVLPSLVSGGLLIGAKQGTGVVTCRTTASWSAPAFVTVAGGSAGLQAGFESADVVMLVMSDRAVAQLFRSSFELGADASAAAGPVGRDAQASTDEKLTAEILSYARSRGLFAGVQLNGAVMKQDPAPAFALYGGSPDVHAILSGQIAPPHEASSFLSEVGAAFPARGAAGGDAVTAPQSR